MSLKAPDHKKRLQRLRQFTAEVHKIMKALNVDQILRKYQEVLQKRDERNVGIANKLVDLGIVDNKTINTSGPGENKPGFQRLNLNSMSNRRASNKKTQK